jgi:hypothetical protein
MRPFAIGCDSLQKRKKQTQNPPALAVMGSPPPGTKIKRTQNQMLMGLYWRLQPLTFSVSSTQRS